MRTIQGADGPAPRRNCGPVNDCGRGNVWPANSPQVRHSFALRTQFDPCLTSPQRDSRDVTTNCMAGGWPYRQRRMAAALLVAASTLLAAPASASDDGATARETIVVEGNRRVEADTVRSYFHAWPGQKLDAAALDAAL